MAPSLIFSHVRQTSHPRQKSFMRPVSPQQTKPRWTVAGTRGYTREFYTFFDKTREFYT